MPFPALLTVKAIENAGDTVFVTGHEDGAPGTKIVACQAGDGSEKISTSLKKAFREGGVVKVLFEGLEPADRISRHYRPDADGSFVATRIARVFDTGARRESAVRDGFAFEADGKAFFASLSDLDARTSRTPEALDRALRYLLGTEERCFAVIRSRDPQTDREIQVVLARRIGQTAAEAVADASARLASVRDILSRGGSCRSVGGRTHLLEDPVAGVAAPDIQKGDRAEVGRYLVVLSLGDGPQDEEIFETVLRTPSNPSIRTAIETDELKPVADMAAGYLAASEGERTAERDVLRAERREVARNYNLFLSDQILAVGMAENRSGQAGPAAKPGFVQRLSSWFSRRQAQDGIRLSR